MNAASQKIIQAMFLASALERLSQTIPDEHGCPVQGIAQAIQQVLKDAHTALDIVEYAQFELARVA